MPWSAPMTVQEERFAMVSAVLGGMSRTAAAERWGVSRPTVNLWVRRFEEGGYGGLADRSRRPGSSPGRTSVAMEELVVSVRRSHPAWGGRKIAGVLARAGHGGVPSPSTITQILRRRGLLAAAGERPVRRAVGSFEAAGPNDLWQVDFKGDFPLALGGRCFPLGVLDDHSRYNLNLTAHTNQQTATVRDRFEAVFDRYGLPTRMLFDNGSPWGTGGSPTKWTGLTVWLLDLGIVISHSRPRHPQTLGKEERFHATLDREVLDTRPQWDTPTDVQAAFDAWRPIYNHQRPHDSLGATVVPADRYQPSPRRAPDRIAPATYPDSWATRRVDTSPAAQISWHGTHIRIGKPFRGRTVGIAPPAPNGTTTIYYRTTPIKTLQV